MKFCRKASVIGISIFLVTALPALAAIHPGDQLSVRVFNHPELTAENVKVDSHGEIFLPVVGVIQVAGRDSRTVASTIAARLRKFVLYPAVDVSDQSEGQSIFVTGGPGGVVPFAPGETLAAAMADVEKELQKPSAVSNASANLVTDDLDRSRIDIRRVRVLRDGAMHGPYDVQALRRVGNPGPPLFAGDTLAFADKPIDVTLLGDVQAPGHAYLWSDEPLGDAISQVGGLKDSAAVGRIALQRQNENPRLIALGDPVINVLPAHPGDTLIFPSSPRVMVAGMVYSPGVATLRNNFTLLGAMYSAGGVQKWANLTDVQVTRGAQTTHYDVTKLTHGDQSQNPMLADGDTVFVPEGHKVDFSEAFGAIFGFGNLIRE